MANNGFIQDEPDSSVIQGGGLPDTYKPSPFVVAAHGISNANFAWDGVTGFLTTHYLRKVITTPLVLFCLGVVSLLLLNCGLAMRRCFRWMRGLPFITPNTEKPEEFINYQRIAVVIFFNVFLILALMMDFFSFIGNAEIDRAFIDFEKGVEEFQTLFDQLKISATSLTGYAANLRGHFQIARFASCYQINFLYTKIITFASNSDLLLHSVSNVDLFLANLINAVRTDIHQIKNGVFYFLWLLGLLTIGLLKSFQILRRRKWVKCAMAFAMFTFVLEIVACFIFMVMASLFSDACMAPSKNIISIIPVGPNANYSDQQAMYYYATCTGHSVVGGEVDDTWASIRLINNSLNLLTNTTSSVCYGDRNIQEMFADIAKIVSAFEPIAHVTLCGPIQAIWRTMVNQTLCTDLFNGFYGLWIAQLLTSFFIYFAIIMASLSYQYYDMPVEDIVDTDAVVVIGGQKGGGNVDFSMVVPIFDSPSRNNSLNGPTSTARPPSNQNDVNGPVKRGSSRILHVAIGGANASLDTGGHGNIDHPVHDRASREGEGDHGHGGSSSSSRGGDRPRNGGHDNGHDDGPDRSKNNSRGSSRGGNDGGRSRNKPRDMEPDNDVEEGLIPGSDEHDGKKKKQSTIGRERNGERERNGSREQGRDGDRERERDIDGDKGSKTGSPDRYKSDKRDWGDELQTVEERDKREENQKGKGRDRERERDEGRVSDLDVAPLDNRLTAISRDRDISNRGGMSGLRNDNESDGMLQGMAHSQKAMLPPISRK